jgi:stage II sporulation protein E
VVFTLFGAGLYSLIGNYVYISIAAGCIIFAVRLFKNPSAVIVALVLSLPIAISTLSVNYLTAFIIFSIIVLVFCNTGRGAESAAGLATCALYFYLNGAFTVGAGIAAVRALLLICCLLLPALLSDKKLEYLLRLLTVKRVMPEAMKNSYKFLMSEKLFKISQVFREIECAFSQTEEEIDEKEVKLRIFSDLKEKCCTSCERREKCAKSNVYSGFSRLIDCGCIKGKVNLVDLPESVTVNCSFPTDVITYLNKLLADYRRFNIEAENMKSGRKLLANQAKGVSEVLKNCATEFARRQENMEDKQNLLLKKLSERGIICYEIQFSGENADDVYIITEEKPKLAAIRQTLFECTGKNFILKDKQIYDGQKCCLIFTSPPLYDAAFGVAFAIKEGEKLSGDTHSVIKINEHSFLIVLSDGMGSGEYAKKVSATAISLIEAFYRAEMPTDTVLDTINKLICFNRDERFTCIDIAQINLNTLESAFIKIGSPAGVIVRTGEIKVLEAGSLPLGILESIKPKTCKEQLKEGDIVVFMSDGITSAFPSATDLYEFLSTLKPLNPQSLADKILARALESAGSATDDMTVLCTRIFKRVTD